MKPNHQYSILASLVKTDHIICLLNPAFLYLLASFEFTFGVCSKMITWFFFLSPCTPTHHHLKALNITTVLSSWLVCSVRLGTTSALFRAADQDQPKRLSCGDALGVFVPWMWNSGTCVSCAECLTVVLVPPSQPVHTHTCRHLWSEALEWPTDVVAEDPELKESTNGLWMPQSSIPDFVISTCRFLS